MKRFKRGAYRLLKGLAAAALGGVLAVALATKPGQPMDMRAAQTAATTGAITALALAANKWMQQERENNGLTAHAAPTSPAAPIAPTRGADGKFCKRAKEVSDGL